MSSGLSLTSSTSSSSSSSSVSSISSSSSSPQSFDATTFPSIASFAVDFYINDFTGVGRVRRLIFLAETFLHFASAAATSTSLSQSASSPALGAIALRCYRQAISESKALGQPQLYVEALAAGRDKLGNTLGEEQDQKWISTMQRQNTEKYSKLEGQFNLAKKDGDKDLLKVALLNLGDYYFDRGDFTLALQKYIEARELLSSKERLQVTIQLIRCSVFMNTFTQAKNLGHELKQTFEPKKVSAISSGEQHTAGLVAYSQGVAAIGLAFLKSAARADSYASAARHFLLVAPELAQATTFKDIVSLKELAVATVLCGLASFPRHDVKSELLYNSKFKKFLDLLPSYQLSSLIHNFYSSNFAAVLQHLDLLRPFLFTDFYLQAHVDKLYRLIRDKIFIEYFKPYSSLDMKVMASSLRYDVNQLEKSLAELIADNKIAGRIDSANKILHARHADLKSNTYQQAYQMAGNYIRDSRALLMRMNLIDSQLSLKGKEKEQNSQTTVTMYEENLMGPSPTNASSTGKSNRRD